MNEVTFNGQYADFKNILDIEIKEAAAGFVRIGYLLKVARDTDILSESGYSSVAEFAKAEYGLTKDIVSRYIAINDRYSENGYSDTLQEKYTGYGVAKLAEMLTLPEEIVEQLPAEMTRKEIQEIKKEYAEEKSISDLEVMMEQPGPSLNNNLEKALYEYFRIEENYKRLHETQLIYGWRKDEVVEVIAPEGLANIRVRIPAVGRVMLVIDEMKDKIVLTNMRTLSTETYLWIDLADAIEKFKFERLSFEDAYFVIYKERLTTQKAEVAPVQQVAEPVNVAKLVENTESEAAKEEEQIPGQMEVGDYPELLPESTFKEVKNVNSDADEGKQSGAGDIDGMSAGSGNDVDAVEPGNDSGVGGVTVQSDDEGAGAAESNGCKADTGRELLKKTFEQFDDITLSIDMIRWKEEIPEKQQIKELHDMAINLAAGFEKLLAVYALMEE